MGYPIRLRAENCRCVKATRDYPWPCASDPNRVYTLFGVDCDYPDILVKGAEGVWYKQTGLGTFGHIIKDEETCDVPREDGEGWYSVVADSIKHCATCTCDKVVSEFRARMLRLFSGVPEAGCLDYRHNSGYCGLPCESTTDFCKIHRKKAKTPLRLG